MKTYKIKLLTLAYCCLLSVLWSETHGMEGIIDGDYKICCFTKNGGARYLEARPDVDLVKALLEKDLKESKELPDDQKWSLKRKDGYYQISCFTQDGGVRYLEAFSDGEVRPRAKTKGQNQKWLIEYIEKDYYRISCNIKVDKEKNELKYLESFPGSSDLPGVVKEESNTFLFGIFDWFGPISRVYMKDKSDHQDQKWKFIKLY